MSRLSDLLAQVQRLDPQLAKDLDAEVKALGKLRKFGLNFERHQPEAVELPGRLVRRGDKVRVLPARDGSTKADKRIWHVAGFSADRSTARLVLPHPTEPDACEAPLADLVVVAEFRDRIFPGLASVERIERGGAKPFHAVINAENFHALQALTYTHEASVDAIYIDPPYNTGNQGWIYNDAYVAADDVYKHSKWLAFMERRLLLAKRLLKPTGVIIVAIGDDEHHRLRMLMDQVFGAENFLANVVWQGGVKNDARFTGAGLDYMVIYSRDLSVLGPIARWKENRSGAEAVVDSARQAFKKANGDEARATELHRQWLKRHKAELEGVLPLFNSVVAPGRAARINGDLSFPGRGGPRYELRNPRTGQPCKIPMRGWGWTEETMRKAVADGRVYFPASDDVSPQGIAFLDERMEAVPRPSFVRERFLGSRHVENVLGGRRFPYPKDHEVLMRWLRMVAPNDAVILDFFGGSGSTTEAVMRLNAEDGGTRRSILVTNNEVASDDAKKLKKAGHRHGDPEWEARGVFEYVARPRISTVVTGARPDGSTYSEGLEQNVEFFHLSYEQPRVVRHGKSFSAIAPLLWLKAGARGRRIDVPNDSYDVAEAYGVLFNLDHIGGFVDELVSTGSTGESGATDDGPRMAFIVSDDERAFQMVCDELPEHVEPVRLYESYLANFAIGGEQ